MSGTRLALARAGPSTAGHESTSISRPATDWFLAEGATGSYFDMFVRIADPTATDAQVAVTMCSSSFAAGTNALATRLQ